ncbi:MAG: helix-turn-helix domain-containing protein [Pseudomonadota bacterium]
MSQRQHHPTTAHVTITAKETAMLEDQTQSLTPEEAIYVGDTMGGRIVAAREATGHTTAQLARRLGIKSATLQNWENDRAEPRSNKLFMLAGMLNVSPTWILTGRGSARSFSQF